MLILTRDIGQQLRIGEDIIIAVVGLSGDQVKIGIEAPRSVRVLREESGGRRPSGSQQLDAAPRHQLPPT